MRCHLRPDRENPDREFASIVLTTEEVDALRAALLGGLKEVTATRVIDMFGHVTRVSVAVEFLRPCSPEAPLVAEGGRTDHPPAPPRAASDPA